MQDGQITVRRFGYEQGPSAEDTRAKWREYQRESRARARGEILPDEPDADVDESDEQDSKTNEQDLKTDEQDLKPQTKRVSQTSGESQGGVRTDTISGGGLIDSDLVLSVWHDMTGLEFKPGKTFNDMVKDWQSAGVTIQNVRDAITQADGKANTPLYLAIPAKNLHAKETAQARSGDMALERFRKLYREQKQAGGDNGVHE